MKRNKWMEKYAPPGIDVATEKGWYLAGLVVATLWSMWFFIQYLNERNALFEYKNGQPRLIEGAMMCSFEQLMEYRFWLFQVVLVSMLFMVVYHYFYHYQGSKMMYLMRRLPDKWELHRRCVALPIIGAVITVLCMVGLRVLYFAVYIFCTPQQCLPL